MTSAPPWPAPDDETEPSLHGTSPADTHSEQRFNYAHPQALTVPPPTPTRRVLRILSSQGKYTFYSIERIDQSDADTLLPQNALHRSRLELSAVTAPQDPESERLHTSTQPQVRPTSIDRMALAICDAGRFEFFEDGHETDFSRRLVSFVTHYAAAAIEALSYLFLHGRTTPDVATEALRWLGNIEDTRTHMARRNLLEECLKCPSPLVRDGAALGLAFMDDPHALPPLTKAIEREQVSTIRNSMEMVSQQLEDTLADQHREAV